jgi:hypothetical protein
MRISPSLSIRWGAAGFSTVTHQGSGLATVSTVGSTGNNTGLLYVLYIVTGGTLSTMQYCWSLDGQKTFGPVFNGPGGTSPQNITEPSTGVVVSLSTAGGNFVANDRYLFTSYGGQAPLSSGSVSWTNYLSTAESDQLGIMVDALNISSALSIHLIVSWAAANEAGEVISNGPTNLGYIPESIEIPDVAQTESQIALGTFQHYVMNAKEWIIPGSFARTIWTPAAAPYFQLGLWADAGFSSGMVYAYIQLADLGSPNRS